MIRHGARRVADDARRARRARPERHEKTRVLSPLLTENAIRIASAYAEAAEEGACTSFQQLSSFQQCCSLEVEP